MVLTNDCPLCGAKVNQDKRLPVRFLLTESVQQAINTGPLTKSMCLNVMVSCGKQGIETWWQDQSDALILARLTPEEIAQLMHLQRQLSSDYSIRALIDLIYCFSEQMD